MVNMLLKVVLGFAALAFAIPSPNAAANPAPAPQRRTYITIPSSNKH